MRILRVRGASGGGSGVVWGGFWRVIGGLGSFLKVLGGLGVVLGRFKSGLELFGRFLGGPGAQQPTAGGKAGRGFQAPK